MSNTTAGGLAKSFQETAVSARMAGIDINRMAGYLAVVSEVSGDAPESVGTFFRSFLSRMSSIKEGKMIDPETGEDLSTVETVLDNIGIKLRNDQDQFRNFANVLDEVAVKWKEMESKGDTVGQAKIASALGLTRQQEKAKILFENYDTALKYADIAANSLGTAEAKFNDSYLKSVEAAQERFTAQFEALSRTVIDSGIITGVINKGTGLLGTLTAIVDTVKILPILITVAAGAMNGLMNKGVLDLVDKEGTKSGKGLGWSWFGLNDGKRDAKILRELGEIYKQDSIAAGTFDQKIKGLTASSRANAKEIKANTVSNAEFSKGLLSAAANADKMTISTKLLAVGTKALKIAGNMFAGFLAGLALNFLIEQISHIVNAQKEAIEKANALSEEYKTLQSEVDNLQDKISNNQEKINEINKNPLDIIDKSTLAALESENIELQRQLELTKKLAAAKNIEAGSAAYDILTGQTQRYGDIDVGYNEVTGLTQITKSQSVGNVLDSSNYHIEEIKDLNAQMSNLDTTSQSYSKDKATLAQQIEDENKALVDNIKLIDSQKSQLVLSDPAQKTLYDNLTLITERYIALETLSPDLNTFDEIWNSKATDEQKNSLFELVKQGNLTSQSFEKDYYVLSILFKSIGLDIDDVIDHIKKLSKQSPKFNLSEIESLSNILTTVKDKLQLLSSAQETLAAGNQLSESSIQGLIKQYPQLESALTEYLFGLRSEADIQKLLQQETEKTTKSYNDSMRIKLISQIDGIDRLGKLYQVDVHNLTAANQIKLNSAIDLGLKQVNVNGKAINQLALDYNVDLENYKSVQSKKLAVTNAILKSQINKIDMQMGVSISHKEGEEQISKLMAQIVDPNIIENIEKALTFTPKKLDVKDLLGTGKNSNKSSKSEDAVLKEYEKRNAALQHLRAVDKLDNAQYYAAKIALDKEFFDGRKKYTDIDKAADTHKKNIEELYQLQKVISSDRAADIEHEIEKLSLKSKTEQEQIALYKELQANANNAANEYRQLGFKEESDLIQAQQKLWIGYQKNIDSLNKTLFESIKDNKLKSLEAEKEGLEKLLDLTEELIKKETNDKIDALEKQKELYNDILSAKKESLSLTEREHDYDTNVTDKTTELSKLQAQAELLALDDSRESQLKRAELLDQIAEKQKELNEFQHDHSVELQQDALDKELKDYEKTKDEEIDFLKDYLNESGKITQDAIDRIQNHSVQLYGELIAWNSIYGTGIDSDITKPWEAATAALLKYKDVLSAINETNSQIGAWSNPALEGLSSAQIESVSETIEAMKANSNAWKKASVSERLKLEQANIKLSKQIPGATYNPRDGKWYRNDSPLYHTGTAAVGTPTVKQSEVFAILEKSETIITKNHMDKLWDYLKMMSFPLSVPNIPSFRNTPAQGNANKPSIVINAPITLTGNEPASDVKNVLKQQGRIIANIVRKELDT